MPSSALKIGILGGGQLGRMLLQQAACYHVETHLLESDAAAPAVHLCHHFTQGDIRDYDAVYQWGRALDVVTIEIENVNLEALYQLEREGVRVYPRPSALEIIQDKGLQKQFYQAHQIPTADFVLTADKASVALKKEYLPAAHKLRKGGYDGKGVSILQSIDDIDNAFDAPSVLERLVHYERELAVIVARSDSGELAVYPPTEMVADPTYNLVDYLLAPARISPSQYERAQAVAVQVVTALGSAGIFAVELFLTLQGEILVNETAPRAHNSGHHTIEANRSSQYDMQLRVMQTMPLGSTETLSPALMLNLVGEPEYAGPVVYQGIDEALKIKGLCLHLYGKLLTKPGRKMGHITIIDDSYEELIKTAEKLKTTVKVVS